MSLVSDVMMKEFELYRGKYIHSLVWCALYSLYFFLLDPSQSSSIPMVYPDKSQLVYIRRKGTESSVHLDSDGKSLYS